MRVPCEKFIAHDDLRIWLRRAPTSCDILLVASATHRAHSRRLTVSSHRAPVGVGRVTLDSLAVSKASGIEGHIDWAANGPLIWNSVRGHGTQSEYLLTHTPRDTGRNLHIRSIGLGEDSAARHSFAHARTNDITTVIHQLRVAPSPPRFAFYAPEFVSIFFD